jgi:hypothetical protein
MGWLKNKPDPVSDRARALTDEIEELEAQIKRLNNRAQRNDSRPRLRSTAMPGGQTLNRAPSVPVPEAPAPPEISAAEPIFEPVDRDRLKGEAVKTTPQHFNELGVRKYDLPALWQRIRTHFRGPSTPNPKLVSYLAAGGIQGLRPLRYEKRVARNRFIALVLFLFAMLLGVVVMFVRHN